MTPRLAQAFIAGYTGLTAWEELLDRINVFPVADGDTGSNLRISLAPLLLLPAAPAEARARLPLAATGNSGNIAVSFLQELLQAATPGELGAAAERGRIQAGRAVALPRAGTMLDLFACLAAELAARSARGEEPEWRAIGVRLREATRQTATILPELQAAGVVDAGALGIFIFFEHFLQHLAGCPEPSCPLPELFPHLLTLAPGYRPAASGAFCVETLIEPHPGREDELAQFAQRGESVVVLRDRHRLKLHLHSAHPAAVREELGGLGRIVAWRAEDIDRAGQAAASSGHGSFRIVTDAAGSLGRELARREGITLLDSTITLGGESRPESHFTPEELYLGMLAGQKVSTAQASLFTRRQRYAALLGEYGQVLYLCAGSAYTGNHAVALAWQREHDPEQRFLVLDSESASGRLALLALAAARQAAAGASVAAAARFLHQSIPSAGEYIFIDRLDYLVAGGRLSRSSGFFGNLLGMKPVVSPGRDGARKVGVVRNPAGQLEFARKRLQEKFNPESRLLLLLQYTNNRARVEEAGAALAAGFPRAELIVQPLSLTSGVHLGPGSWAVAFLPLGEIVGEAER